jgi:hypothetical protein
LNDLSWLIDRCKTGHALIRLAFVRAVEPEDRGEVRNAVIELAKILDDKMDAREKEVGAETRDGRDPVVLALTRTKVEIYNAVEITLASSISPEEYQPREADRAVHETALAEARAFVGEAFSRRICGARRADE